MIANISAYQIGSSTKNAAERMVRLKAALTDE
jgi:hypothetical protein